MSFSLVTDRKQKERHTNFYDRVDVLARWLVPKYVFPEAKLAVICVTAPIKKFHCVNTTAMVLSQQHIQPSISMSNIDEIPTRKYQNFESVLLKDAYG